MKQNKSSELFLSNARRGLNHWPRWLLGILLVLFMWQAVGAIPFFTVCEYLQNIEITQFQCDGTQITGDSVLLDYLLSNYMFIIGIIGVWIAVRVLHKKTLTQVVTGRKTFDYNRVVYAIWVGFLLHSALLILDVLFIHTEITFRSPSFSEYITFFLFAVVLTTYQAGFEEIFFRGYLLQGLSLIARNRVVITIVSSVLFVLPHLANPEPFEYGFAPYATSLFMFALFMTVIVLVDGGIELAIGYHALNNLWIGLIANTEVTALQTPSLLIVPIERYAMFPDVPVQLIVYIVLLVILNKKYKWFTWKTLMPRNAK